MSSRAEPLITRDRVLAVRERMLADGTVDKPLDQASLRQALDQAMALGAEGIVLALLHSYRNPAHEREAARLIGQWAPTMPVFCSSDVWPIIREYERTATATIHEEAHFRRDGRAAGASAARRRQRGAPRLRAGEGRVPAASAGAGGGVNG